MIAFEEAMKRVKTVSSIGANEISVLKREAQRMAHVTGRHTLKKTIKLILRLIPALIKSAWYFIAHHKEWMKMLRANQMNLKGMVD